VRKKDRVVQKDKPAIILPTHIQHKKRKKITWTKQRTVQKLKRDLKIHKKHISKKENDGGLHGIKLTF